MSDKKKDITIDDLPDPISRQDKLLHNIIDDTPDIEDLDPLSRQEIYLKYIALNGSAGGGGESGNVNVVQNTGPSTTSVMSQNAVTNELNKKVDNVDGKGLSTNDFTIEEKEKLDSIPSNISNIGTAAYCDTGTNEGNVPIINSLKKLDNSVIPSLAITDIFVAKSEDEMLNIADAEKGDVCVRTDENKTYILNNTPTKYSRSVTKTTSSDWIELLAPTDEVTSVNGKKGNVVVTAEDVDTYTKSQIDNKVPAIVQYTGTLTDSVMSQNAVTNELHGKVTKIDGKGLSTNDFTTEEKNKLEKAIVNMATGSDAIAIGNRSNAAGMSSIALGDSSDASGNYSIVIGLESSSKKEDSIAIGQDSKSDGLASIAIGCLACAEDKDTTDIVNGSVAIGYSAHSLYAENVVIGNGAEVTGKNSVAVGGNATAKDDYVFSVGSGSSDFSPETRRIVNVTDPQNPQDAATKNYVDTRINPTVLYSNDSGTKENFTLSQPYTDFSRIGVYAQSQFNIDSVYNEIYTPITNYMTLACTTFQDGDHYNMVVWRLAHIIFDGNEVKFDINGAASFPNGDNKEFIGGPNIPQPDGSNDGIKIVRVVGYK